MRRYPSIIGRHLLLPLIASLGVVCFVNVLKQVVAHDRSRVNVSRVSQEQKKTGPPVAQGEIRKIDFANFTYPLTHELARYFAPDTSITLVNGRKPPITEPNSTHVKTMGFALNLVKYDNVNGNVRDEEGIVVLEIESGGSAMGQCVYIYALTDGALELLWRFYAGDRSHGGLRQVYGNNGNLIVERYNNDVSYATDGSAQTGGACCARTYTRARYEWSGLAYQLISAEQLLNPNGNASMINVR